MNETTEALVRETAAQAKGCPICGAAPEISNYRETSDETGEVEGYAGIECPSREHFCGVHADSLAAALAIWNTRHAQP